MTKRPNRKRRKASGATVPAEVLHRAQQQAQPRRVTPANPQAIPRVRARRGGR
jgi:hypothetical protein